MNRRYPGSRNPVVNNTNVGGRVEACPSGAIVFGNLDDPESEVARLAGAPGSFRLLERLGTGAKVYYHTERDWVRRQADGRTAAGDGRTHG